MTEERPSIFEWAKRYVGDPDSWEARGSMQLHFLRELGLKPQHNLLDIGCGCLSMGHAAIRYLHEGRYVGLEPNGWLVEAWLEHEQERGQMNYVGSKKPRFLWASDFDASELGLRFEFAFAHSVLSHTAHWQLAQCLTKVRDVMVIGGVFLASIRLAEIDSYAERWAYPDNTFFRLDTVKSVAHHAGFAVRHAPELRDELVAFAPNDVHDWVVFEACDAERFHTAADHDPVICPAAREERERTADVLSVLAGTQEALRLCFPLLETTRDENGIATGLEQTVRDRYERARSLLEEAG